MHLYNQIWGKHLKKIIQLIKEHLEETKTEWPFLVYCKRLLYRGLGRKHLFWYITV